MSTAYFSVDSIHLDNRISNDFCRVCFEINVVMKVKQQKFIVFCKTEKWHKMLIYYYIIDASKVINVVKN